MQEKKSVMSVLGDSLPKVPSRSPVHYNLPSTIIYNPDTHLIPSKPEAIHSRIDSEIIIGENGYQHNYMYHGYRYKYYKQYLQDLVGKPIHAGINLVAFVSLPSCDGNHSHWLHDGVS